MLAALGYASERCSLSVGTQHFTDVQPCASAAPSAIAEQKQADPSRNWRDTPRPPVAVIASAQGSDCSLPVPCQRQRTGCTASADWRRDVTAFTECQS